MYTLEPVHQYTLEPVHQYTSTLWNQSKTRLQGLNIVMYTLEPVQDTSPGTQGVSENPKHSPITNLF